ncbi:hypothetical protein GJV85_12030 [Sulfurimonas aquatica]|uniref:Caa(3)-type oxidase subunit IV n=1 Tax=Sulfurimonas aquatica TaxID=2672570 RepID=A0A975B226_9BACT|nr:cytochrome C oxidase subunit IV family protein [Sulfurimonas aquatica]QSZ42812.1 hypothetical protein GJV85_12030 [Sulfurimonas aquatica]
MDTNVKVDYQAEKGGYYKVLIGLLVLTAVTFIQPTMFLTENIFGIQLLIGLIKALMILFYYMHLKGEKLIGWSVVFSVFLVIFFFLVVIYDVSNFQFAEESHITNSPKSAPAAHSAPEAHAEH